MFLLTTDSSIDIFRSDLLKANVSYVPLTFTVGGVAVEDNYSSDKEFEGFYAMLAKGELPQTSQINPFTHEEFWEKVIAERGEADIIHLSLSGGLSKTYQSACLGAEAFMKKHQNINVYVIDTLAATVASWPLYEKALVLRDNNTDAEIAADALRAYAKRIQVYIIADDLFHLKRGGRVSAAAAAIGSVFSIKPIIVFNDDGKLCVQKKPLGFKKALKTVLDSIEEFCPAVQEKTVYIAHANAKDKADEAAKAIEARFGCKTKIGWIGPVIGTHTGGGTIGIVFEANSRLSINPQ